MPSNPYITAGLAEQHRADLLRQAEQHRLVRAAKDQPATPRILVLAKEGLIRRVSPRWLRPSPSGATGF